MPVLALGVSYRMAPVELLERLAISEDEETKAYRRLSELESVQESVVLSTCNRVEVYAEVEVYHPGFQELKRFLSESTDVPADEMAEPLYSHYEDEAAEHLFSVAAGLDSMVLGEPQVLAQVRAAFRRAERERGADPLVVISRRRERAERLAAKTGATGGSMEQLDEALSGAEVVVSSTGATGTVIGEETLRRTASGRKVFVLDLAVPRDVDPSAASLPGVRLADIDDLAPLVADRRDADDDVEASRRIVQAEVRRFSADRRSRRLAPLIRALHARGERVRADELTRLAPKLAALSDRDRETVEALTQ